jgi:MFS transporter, ACS family, tartrate transporter
LIEKSPTDESAHLNVKPSQPAAPLSHDSIARSALRKASLRLLPLLALGYGAAFIDRVNISFASLQMNRDLHFSSAIYGFGAGLFFLGYATCEIPSNLLLYRFGARRWLARIMLTWGLLAVGMMFVKTPTQFYLMRFLLGMAEAGFFPGAVFYLGQWFPSTMQARAVSRLYLGPPLGSVVMGALAGALLSLQGTLGLAGWQWLFLAEGLLPVLLSLIFLIYLPDTPREAAWLSAEERAWLLNQPKHQAAAEGAHEGLRHALVDPLVWKLGLAIFCMLICAYGYSFSSPAILQKVTALNVTKVGFLVAFMGLLNALGLVLNAIHSDRAGERYGHIILPLLLMAGGYLVGGLSVNPLWVVPALTVSTVGFYCTQGIFFAIPSAFLKGKSAAAGIAAITTIGIVGGFIGPYWMGLMKDLTGNYQRGLMTLAIPALAAAAIMLTVRRSAKPRINRAIIIDR